MKMKIVSQKIPASFTNLPALYELLNKNGDRAMMEVFSVLNRMPGSPKGATCSFQQIASELAKTASYEISFKFYASKNIFVGHNVISHADELVNINYNTRFHSVKKFTLKDWFKNFFHELTHLADQRSVYNFDHDGQKDDLSAPMVVARIAGEVFDRSIERWS